MRINKLESSGLATAYKVIVDKAIRKDSVQFLYVIYDRPTCFSYKVTDKSVCTNRHTDTYETLRAQRSEGDIRMKESQSRAVVDDAVRGIQRSLLCNAVVEDGGLGDVEVKSTLRTCFSSAKTCSATLILAFM